MKRHPAAIAWDKFRIEFQASFDARSLGNFHQQNHFLENRLNRAFQSGWDAAEANAKTKKRKKP